MAADLQIAVFEGGELSVPAKGNGGGEAVLALPLCRFLAKVVRVPPDAEGDAASYATPILRKMSPFPDEDLAVSCEPIRETADGAEVLALALPEGSSDDIAGALDAAKLNVTRVDALFLGALRSAWEKVAPGDGDARRIVLFGGADCTSLAVMDGGSFVFVRALSPGEVQLRDAHLALLEAEDFAGTKPLSEIVLLGDAQAGALASLAPVRSVPVSREDAVAGVAQRTAEPTAANALPETWRGVLEESRFKRKMRVFLSVAGAIWFAAVAVMVGVPKFYDYMTRRAEAERMLRKPEFRKVSEKKKQVEAVRSVSNHDLGALESLRVVSSVLPTGITLSRWTFKRGDSLSFSGTVADGDERRVYNFKDDLAGMPLSQVSGLAEDESTPFFTDVWLPKGVTTKGSKTSFDVECSFKEKEASE